MKPVKANKSIVIAIVDDGVRITHRDLQRFIWTNPGEIAGNGIDDDGNGYVDDVHGWDVADNKNTVTLPQGRLQEFYHGTHLAGIVARIARAAYGDSAADYVKIMSVKSVSDRADRLYIKQGYKGIEYAIKAGADIIICAWGVGHISPEESKILDAARKKGILVVSSAGNFPEERDQFPAAHDSVLAVAGLNHENQKMERSNYGPFVSLSAPGTDIVSAGVLSDDAYEKKDGTSQATAIVAAAAALVKLQHPSYSAEMVKSCLKSSADPIEVTDKQYSAKLGAGKLNIEAAVVCSIFDRKTPVQHEFTNPQGYLHFVSPGAKSSSWTIRPQGVFKGIRFNMIPLRGKAGPGVLKFYAGESFRSRLVVSYRLKDMPGSVYVPGTKAHVTFESAKGSPGTDWLLGYKAEAVNFATLYCRDTVYLNEEGTLEDGSGAGDYSPKTDCKWLITAPKGKVIHFKFTEFDTEAKIDLLYFFNGRGTHEKIMAIFSGPDIPPEFTTWRNEVLVWFVTDGKNQGKGWRAEYQFVDP